MKRIMTRKAIVTGHSRGLGAALSARLARAGWEVLGISRSAGVRIDLSDPAQWCGWLAGPELESFLAGAEEVLLINNAGTVEPIGTGGVAPEQVAGAFQVNVCAAISLTDAVLSRRPEGCPARIVHISSGAGRRPIEGWSVYCATKAALDMHAQVVAAERLPGVRIAAVAPGVVDTGMQETIRECDFPLRNHFRDLKKNGELLSPDEAARSLLALLDRDDFGQRVLTDIRG